MKKIYAYFFVLAGFLLALSGRTQERSTFRPDQYKPDKSSNYFSYFELKYHAGSHPNTSKYIQELLEQGYKALEFRVGLQSTGRQNWQRAHNYPQYGVGFFLGQLGNTEVDSTVGTPSGLFGYVGIPWWRKGIFRFQTDLSVGVSYDFEPYDAESNPYNDVIGSWMNVYFNLNIIGYFKLSNRLDLGIGWDVTHFSNGRWRTPNKGINLMGLNVGLSYNFNPITPYKRYKDPNADGYERPEFNRDPLPPVEKFSEINFMGSIGTSTLQGDSANEAGPRYFNSSWLVEYSRKFWRRGKYNVGLDFFYDGSLAAGYDKPESEVSFLERTSYAAHVGHDFLIERFSLVTQVGFYVYKKSEERGSWFIRAGGKVSISDQWSAHVCLKTMNGGIADWIEWGMVYSLRLNKNKGQPAG